MRKSVAGKLYVNTKYFHFSLARKACYHCYTNASKDHLTRLLVPKSGRLEQAMIRI
jgi:hypothetical protein